MNIYIDCEWNDYKGALISLALVAANGEEFYEVLECKKPSDWIATNVMPILEKPATGATVFVFKLDAFLKQFDTVNIIADWPEDIAYFCNALITNPGMRMGPSNMTFEVRRELFNAQSENPHNALWDARSIRTYDMRPK